MADKKGQVSRRVRAGTFWTVEHLTSPGFLLLVATLALCAFGLVMVFSSSSIELVDAGSSAWHTFVMQLLYMVVGWVVFALVAHKLTVHRLMEWKWIAGLTALAVLLLVLVYFVGTEVNGAKRWLRLGSSASAPSIQPSEFAKIVIVMAGAYYAARWGKGEISGRNAVVRLLPFAAIPMILIYSEHDLGTLIIISVGLFAVAYLAKVRTRYFVIVLVLAAIALVGAVFFVSYRNVRLNTWLDPYSDYYGNGWQSIHGFRAIASGGFFGLGLGESRQKYSYLPEAENDYIFAIIAEELGFFGVVVMLAFFVLFAYCGLRISFEARERSLQSSFLAGSLTALIEFQAFLNMAGVTGLLPMTGRPLPFITAGGSSVISCLIMAGLIYGVACENASGLREERERRRVRTRDSLSVVQGGPADEPAESARPSGALLPGELTSIPGGRAEEAPDAGRARPPRDRAGRGGRREGAARRPTTGRARPSDESDVRSRGRDSTPARRPGAESGPDRQ